MKAPAKSELIAVAHGMRTRGLKGEIVAQVLTDFPERFEQISRMYAVRNEEVRPLELEQYWFQNDRVVLKFAGVDDVDTAKELTGFDFALPEADRVELSENEYYDWELEGCSVVVKEGSQIGTVRSVLRTGGVALLDIADEAGRKHLVPMAQPIVINVDVAGRQVVIDPPEGLLDL